MHLSGDNIPSSTLHITHPTPGHSPTQGETYKNPLSKNLDAPVPIKANLGHTKTAVITAGSAPDRGVAPGACSDKLVRMW